MLEDEVKAEWRDKSVSPLRVLREMATNSAIRGDVLTAELFNSICDEANRKSTQAHRLRKALKLVLFCLHARPMFGGYSLDLEDAITAGNQALDKENDHAR